MRKRRPRRKFYTKDQRLQYRVARMMRQAGRSWSELGPPMTAEELVASLSISSGAEAEH